MTRDEDMSLLIAKLDQQLKAYERKLIALTLLEMEGEILELEIMKTARELEEVHDRINPAETIPSTHKAKALWESLRDLNPNFHDANHIWHYLAKPFLGRGRPKGSSKDEMAGEVTRFIQVGETYSHAATRVLKSSGINEPTKGQVDALVRFVKRKSAK